MFHYGIEQKTLEIGNVRIGGQPGMVPTVMIGTLFHSSDKLIIEPTIGKMDNSAVESAINQLQVLNDKTALPSMLDVVATTEEAIVNYLRQLVDMTEMPLLVDGSGSAAINLAGLAAARDGGFLDRVVLNAMTPESSATFCTELKAIGVQNAIALAFTNDTIASVSGRVESADLLIERTTSAGIDNVMFDTGVVDLLTLGLACRALTQLKEKHGLPVGCGAHNAVDLWKNLVSKFGSEAKKPVLAGANLLPIVLGGDFILYGPVKHAPTIFPVVAMANIALSGALMEEGLRPPKPHPRYVAG